MVFHYGRLTRDGGADPRELTFAVLALQTTGLDVDWGARLCEVAVVRMRGDGTVLDEYATLVNPGIPVGNTELHGITDAWMVGVPGFEQIAGDRSATSATPSSSATTSSPPNGSSPLSSTSSASP